MSLSNATWSLKDIITVFLAVSSFLVSGYTLWVTQIRRGQLKMTRPTLLCIVREKPSGTLKIFLKTLLYATASKGRVIQSMFVRVQQPHGSYVFDFWGHTETNQLKLGSGLFVGANGVTCDHHFNLRHGSHDFLFVDGQYHIEIYAVVVGNPRAEKLMEIKFALDGLKAAELIQIPDTAFFLYWNADTNSYDVQLERAPKPNSLFSML